MLFRNYQPGAFFLQFGTHVCWTGALRAVLNLSRASQSDVQKRGRFMRSKLTVIRPMDFK